MGDTAGWEADDIEAVRQSLSLVMFAVVVLFGDQTFVRHDTDRARRSVAVDVDIDVSDRSVTTAEAPVVAPVTEERSSK